MSVIYSKPKRGAKVVKDAPGKAPAARTQKKEKKDEK